MGDGTYDLGALHLQSYAGNPVGDANTLLAGSGSLEGVAVARDEDGSLRFLFSRRFPIAGGGRRWDFVPATQVWGQLEAPDDF